MLAIVVQLHQYFFAVGDPGIGIYLYIAHLWLHGGHLPYVAAWEYKPPGLFAYIALAIKLSGDRPSIAMHVLVTLSTIATALLLWRFATACDARQDDRAGRFAALFSVLTSSENEGYLGDSEMLAQPFVAAAFLLARIGRSRSDLAALAGLCAGLALQMKLSLLPIVFVPTLILLRERNPKTIAAYAGAFVLPIVADVAIYIRGGALHALVDANVGETVRRLAGLHGGILRENLPWFGSELRILAPAVELALLAFSRRANADRLATWGWLAAALISIVGIGEFYDRQFVLIEAPVAVLGGIGLRCALDTFVRPRRVARAATVGIFVATFALHDYWETSQAAQIAYHRMVLRQRTFKQDEYSATAAALRRIPAAARSLYLLQVSPMLYVRTGAAAPTRFPYSDHLLDPRMTTMIGISGRAELERIFATHPAVVVAGKLREPRFDPASVAFVESRLRHDYERIAEHPAAIYRLLPSAVPPMRPR